MMIRFKQLKTCIAAVVVTIIGGLSASALETPWIQLTFDDTSSANWYRSTGTGGYGSGKAYNGTGNYSANGKNAIGNFDATRLGHGLRDCSPWGDIQSPGTAFTIGLCFKTVADFGNIIFELGEFRHSKEGLFVHSKSANEIGVSVVKGTAIQRSLTVPVTDVTRYHAYVLRYNNGTVSVEVDGVPVSGTIQYTHSINHMQVLGGYNKQNEMADYPHGCGVVDTGSWYVTSPNSDNVVDDVSIWTKLLTEAEGLEYAARFGDSVESLEETTLVIEKGCLHPDYPDFKDATLVRKTTAGAALFDTVKTFPALDIAGGEVSFQNGLAETHAVTGALTLSGGTTLDFDVVAGGCDALAPGSLDLSGASAENPVTLNLRVADDVDHLRDIPLIAGGLTDGDETKFVLALTGHAVTAKLAVRDGALVLDLTTTPEILFTYDTNTHPAWRNNAGANTAVTCGGNYSANGKNAIANFTATKAGYGIWGASPWYDRVNLASGFTFALCFKTVDTANQIIFCLGQMRQQNKESLLVLSESANSICLAVEKNLAIQRTFSIPVADVTKYHSYVFRHAADGQVTVEVDGVPVAGSIAYTVGDACLQVLGGYSKLNDLPDYPHGCGVVDAGSWVVTTPNSDNVVDDVRIWSNRVLGSDGQAFDYYLDFGDIDRSVDGTTLVVRSGQFLDGLIPTGCTLISKVTDGTLRVGASAAFAVPVTVSAGGLSFADGAAKTHSFASLTLAGGTHLRFDVAAAATDCLAPDALALDGSVTPETPVVLDFNVNEDSSFSAVPTLISSGLQPGDEAKFVYTGVPAGSLVLFVEGGALKARYADLTVVTEATWTGLGRAGDLTDAENWTCVNAIGETMEDAIPTADTVVTVPGETAGNFCWVQGTSFPHKALTIGQPIALSADCNWTGLSLDLLPENTVIDLRGHDLRLLAAEVSEQKFTVTDTLDAPGGALYLDAESGIPATVNNADFAVTGNARLIKDTPGTIIWQAGTVASSVPMFVSNGVFRLATNVKTTFGGGGEITIANKGQLDTADKDVTALVDRTFYIAGDGPDSSGALVNSKDVAMNMREAYLIGDATFGGIGRIDFRASKVGGTCALHGEDYTLTVKNGNVVAFCGGNSSIYVKRVVVDGGKFQPCGDATGAFEISEKIGLVNGGRLVTWTNKNTPYRVNVPVEVGEGGGYIRCDGGSYEYAGKVTVLAGNTLAVCETGTFADVEVCEGATLTFDKCSCGFTGTVADNGTIRIWTGTLNLQAGSTLSGSGEIRQTGGTLGLLGGVDGFTGRIALENGSLTAAGVGDAYVPYTAIDLSQKTEPFAYDNRNWTVPAGRALQVYLGSRANSVKTGDVLMTWTTKPSIRFVEANRACGLLVRETDLAVLRGLMLIIR